MVRNLSSATWVNEWRESMKVDKVWKYLDHLFNPWEEPNGIFLYDWEDPVSWIGGGSLFSKVVESEAYNKWENIEEILYQRNRHNVIESFSEKNAKNIVDMGPGDGDKSAKILSATLGDRLEGKTYIPVDVNPHFVKKSSEEVQHYVHKHDNIRIKTAGINIDFLESSAGLKDMKDKLYMMFGGSIGNFSDTDIVKILRNMASDGGKKNNIIMSFFLAPDKEAEDYNAQIQEMRARYGDPDTSNPYYNKSTHTAIEAWIMWGFSSLWIDTSKLEFFVRYDEMNTKVVLGAKVKETMIVKHNGKNYTKEAGEELLAIQSKRFTESKIQTLAEQAGVTFKQTDSHEWMGVAFMESGWTEEAKEKRATKKKWAIRTAIASTLLATGIRGGKEMEKTSLANKQKEALENIMRNKLEPLDFPHERYVKQNSEEKQKYFIEKSEQFYRDLSDRYDLQNLSESKQAIVKAHLDQWLLNQDEKIFDITEDHSFQGLWHNYTHEKIAELIESFIDNNSYIFASHNISLKLHESLIKHEEMLKHTLSDKVPDTITVPQLVTITNPRAAAVTRGSKYKWIWPYTATNGKTYVTASYEHQGKQILIGCLVNIPHDVGRQQRLERYKDNKLGDHPMTYPYPDFTSEIGKLVAMDYFKKPYFHKLADKILQIIKNNNLPMTHEESNLVATLTHRSQEGHNFSWLTHVKDEKILKCFIYTYFWSYLPETNIQYDKSDKIHTIAIEAAYGYLKHVLKEEYTDPHKRWALESAVFRRLCDDDLYTANGDSIGVQKWINENIDLFKPFMKQLDYPRINPENWGILAGARPYHKKHATDIKSFPGLAGREMFTYEDIQGNLYEVCEKEWVLYARYILTDSERKDLGDPPEYLAQIRDKIIAQCRKEKIGIRSPEVEKRIWKQAAIADQQIIDWRKMFIDHTIMDNIYAHNSEIGNIVIQDYLTRMRYNWL